MIKYFTIEDLLKHYLQKKFHILEEHRRIIDEYAAKGYKYVGYVPTDITCSGQLTKMDLIFEIDQ